MSRRLFAGLLGVLVWSGATSNASATHTGELRGRIYHCRAHQALPCPPETRAVAITLRDLHARFVATSRTKTSRFLFKLPPGRYRIQAQTSVAGRSTTAKGIVRIYARGRTRVTISFRSPLRSPPPLVSAANTSAHP